MWWPYALVFVGAFLVDCSPVPLPPAFVVMIFMQIQFDLDLWVVIPLGVAGSILGRYLLTLYIPRLSGRIFTRAKNADVRFLGSKLKQKGWKSQAFIVAYCMMPLPSTPLFLAAGMARIKPVAIIPAFTVGKFSSDLLAVLMGAYAAKNSSDILRGLLSWKSITGFSLGLLLLFALLFVDWQTLLREKKFKLKFNIWK